MRSEIPVYRSDLILQRGRGLGSLFRGLSRFLVPTLKAASRTALKAARHPVTRKVGKKVGKHLAKVAVTSLSDMQQGTPARVAVKRRLQEELPIMAEESIKPLLRGRGNSVTTRKRRRTTHYPRKRDIFEE